MSFVKHALISLLTLGDAYGSQLGSEILCRSGHKLNTGQIYSTLDRLQSEGLVTTTGATADGLQLLSVTEAGAQAVHNWAKTPAESYTDMVAKVSLLATVDAQLFATAVRVQRDYWVAKDNSFELQHGNNYPHQVFTEEATTLLAGAAFAWLSHAEKIGAAPLPLNAERPKRGRPSTKKRPPSFT
ncbi:PadR family transcriptional regulator [Canibacter zhoujuaniae]|uniref:PadR family transcriptional regulator n=1 Tax=Canibacter zhoujuaniae TaxID=2708343 RepID=UPI00141F63FB|nr:PadR family transcriptional regulator [Canibacter zhoujuaniae]